MEVKKIFGSLRQEKKKATPYFALQIEDNLVKSALWVVENETVKVLALGSVQPWESDEQLLNAIDRSISTASDNLNSSPVELEEPNQVILGLPAAWIQDNKIIPVQLEKLRLIFKQLELTPAGFVVTTEALVHYLKSVEGIPPTAILLGLRPRKIIVALVQLGKTVGVELVDRSSRLEDDLLEGLSRFSQVSFPSRILLYDSQENLEEVKDQLTAYPWQSAKISFLHLPKIEVLPVDFDIKAVALAGGKEIAQAQGLKTEIAASPAQPDAKVASPQPDQPSEPDENFGFVIDQDIDQTQTEIQNVETVTASIPPAPTSSPPPIVSPSPRPPLPFSLKLPSLPLPALKTHLHFGFLKGKGLLVPLVAASILLLLSVGLVVAWWYLPKAEIKLTLTPNNLEKDFTIRLDPSLAEADQAELALPGRLVKASLEGSQSKATTGTKTIGDPAKGEVTVYNRTNSEKKFAVGTELVGPNDLQFTLDEEVTVASQSAGTDYSTVPGKATVKVTASAIGAEGNFASGTEFNIGKHARTDFVARSNAEFTGGTSREIQAVSKQDQESLRESLTADLESKALSELDSQTSDNQQIIADSLESKLIREEMNHKIGDEANEVELSLEIEFSALAYRQEELQALIDEEIKQLLPAGFDYSPQENDYEFSLQEVTAENIAVFSVAFKTKLVPQVDADQIRRDLAGKKPLLAKQYLENIPNVRAVDISYYPKLPTALITMPRIQKNITVNITLD